MSVTASPTDMHANTTVIATIIHIHSSCCRYPTAPATSGAASGKNQSCKKTKFPYHSDAHLKARLRRSNIAPNLTRRAELRNGSQATALALSRSFRGPSAGNACGVCAIIPVTSKLWVDFRRGPIRTLKHNLGAEAVLAFVARPGIGGGDPCRVSKPRRAARRTLRPGSSAGRRSGQVGIIALQTNPL
jgi:hypothetical protein